MPLVRRYPARSESAMDATPRSHAIAPTPKAAASPASARATVASVESSTGALSSPKPTPAQDAAQCSGSIAALGGCHRIGHLAAATPGKGAE